VPTWTAEAVRRAAAEWVWVPPDAEQVVTDSYQRGTLVSARGLTGRASSRSGGLRMIVAFSVTPLGVGEDVASYVADAVRVVRASGLPNRTDAMFTTIEGDWDEVMAVVKAACDAVAERAPRVSVTLKADIRPGVTGAMQAKMESLERQL
jgi:uncharacterized protein (TIGR00106 family)